MTKQAWLLWVWLGGFIACFTTVLLLWPLGDERPDNLPSHVAIITGIYSPYLLPIVTFWLAKYSKEATPSPSAAFSIAVVVSLFFNVVIFALVASIHFQSTGVDVAQNTLTLAPKIAAGLSFLAGPAIGFFFGKAT